MRHGLARMIGGIAIAIASGGALLVAASPAHAVPSNCTAGIEDGTDYRVAVATCTGRTGFVRVKGYCDSSQGGGWIYGPWVQKTQASQPATSKAYAHSFCLFNHVIYEAK